MKTETTPTAEQIIDEVRKMNKQERKCALAVLRAINVQSTEVHKGGKPKK